ncbi:CopG family transcriptional regulator [Sphingobium sp. CFD-1]|uniref:CopG family transcriptional regulator n=1 Tax=Sphingobium sp. CFD-1 TaxID=2878545 RepID=UPI00214AB1AA|nr:CopG family transcriptional regulator [Sphingobium sp. CFD-1]
MKRAPKIRQNLYIDREIGDALEALAKGRAGNKSRLVNDALRSWIHHRGVSEIDAAFRMRLDGLSGELAGARRDIDILLESLALFIRYQLMVTPPLADSDAAGRAQGRERFEAFITQVGRQIATGKRSIAAGHAEGEGV